MTIGCKLRKFIRKNDGVAIIEAAFIIPVLILIVFGGMEFGMYFVKSQIANNGISNIITPLQQDPEDYTLSSELRRTGGSFLGLTSGSNYACAQAYATYEAAHAGTCQGQGWQTQRPDGVDEGTPYYVAISTRTTNPASILFGLDEIVDTQIVRIGNSGSCPGSDNPNAVCLGEVMIQWGWTNDGGEGFFDPIFADPPSVTMEPSCKTPQPNTIGLRTGNIGSLNDAMGGGTDYIACSIHVESKSARMFQINNEIVAISRDIETGNLQDVYIARPHRAADLAPVGNVYWTAIGKVRR